MVLCQPFSNARESALVHDSTSGSRRLKVVSRNGGLHPLKGAMLKDPKEKRTILGVRSIRPEKASTRVGGVSRHGLDDNVLISLR